MDSSGADFFIYDYYENKYSPITKIPLDKDEEIFLEPNNYRNEPIKKRQWIIKHDDGSFSKFTDPYFISNFMPD